MVRLCKPITAALLLLIPFYALAQDVDPEQQTTVDWRQWLSAGSVAAGSFVGVYNDALVITGAGIEDTIRIATRTTLEESDTARGEASVVWHDTGLRLSGNRSHGASVSHLLGVFAIGGTDRNGPSRDVTLIRWDTDSSTARLFGFPALPGVALNNGAGVIGDTLYVVADKDHDNDEYALYALDLSRVQTDESGRPLTDGAEIRLLQSTDEQGASVSPWRKLPSLPSSSSVRDGIAAVVQDNGRGRQLYVIATGRESTSLWVFNPLGDEGAGSWQRKSDVDVDSGFAGLDGGAAVALGQSHILLLTGPGENGIRRALSYNTITDVWAVYNDAPPLSSSAATTTHAVSWGGDIILVNGSASPGDSSANIWTVDVNGPALTFGWLNMTVLVVYLLSMVMVGVYFVFKNSNTDDYFRGGQSIPWWAAACSIYATMLSSLTYVALPALVYRTDWLIYVGTMMILVVAPIAIYIAMPFFRQIDATSAYEYLSKRFNMPVRLFASGLFTLFHIGRMGIVLALTALALAAVTPLDAWQSVLVMGVLSLIYCTLGGVEAVIWTDTIQTVVLLIGAVLCFLIIISGVDGGFAGFIDAGMADDKFRMVNLDFGSGSITTLTIWVIVLGGIGQNISSYTADQAVVQRYMTTEDTKAAAKSIWANGILAVPGALLFFCIGTGLYAFYRSQPEKLDPTIQIDQIFPSFIGAELPIGIAGIIVAGIFAAAQSTVSTSMNSIATTIVTDFMRPFDVCRSEKSYLNAARLLTFTMGVIGTLAGLLFISPEIRSLMEEYFKVIGMFMGALGGLFVLGVSTRRANGWGAMIGIFAGVVVMISAWLMQWADGYLFATIGILTCLLVGYLASLLLPSDRKDLDGLTLYTMRKGGNE